MRSIKTFVVALLASLGVQSAYAQVKYINPGKNGYPFSEAVRVNETLYLSGQLGQDPDTNALVPGGIEAESHQMMRNLKSTLEANGYSLDHLVKCTVFLADMAEWPAFNEIYRSYFQPERLPARSALDANALALNARVEIDCIAVLQPKAN